jgi:ribosomal protein S24E
MLFAVRDKLKTLKLNIAKSRRNRLLQRRTYQLVIQSQTVSPENKHTNDMIHTEQVIFRNVYA